MSEEVNTQEAPATEPENNEPQISLADFSATLQVIDVCTQRGAFRGEELSSVGQLRDRINAFVQHHAPAKEEGEEATEEATEEVVEETAE
jgi:hypothetical protein|tara:strand:- start:539 stop:808 length:270 start_codon:yes stop_codon:yes gene_type:complete